VHEVSESTPDPQLPKLIETDVSRPDGPADESAAYTIWSINLADQSASYNVEAEVDGVKIVWNVKRAVSDLPPCAK
jgi:hypothetical protein